MMILSMASLRRQTQPFDDPDWIYEIKHDGFRGVVPKGGAELGKAQAGPDFGVVQN